MLVRIKFVTNSESNRLKRDELKELIEFMGEDISTVDLKKDENGKISTLSWRDTFDKENVKEEYTIVEKSEFVQIEDHKLFLSDLNEFMKYYPHLEVSIKGLPKAVAGDDNQLFNRISEMQNKIESMVNRFDKQVEFNQKCDVHVPGFGLMNVNRLAFAENKCTEELQEILNRGWRILAVCPQPDQRRPDYILGMNVDGKSDSVEVVQF